MHKSVLIIGAGTAGLTTAENLSCTRLKVDVHAQHTWYVGRDLLKFQWDVIFEG